MDPFTFPFKYSEKEGKWLQKLLTPTQKPFLPTNKVLKILSFNTLTEMFYKIKLVKPLSRDLKRWQYIADKLFEKLNADIICLQEINSRSLEIFKNSEFLKKNYFMSHIGNLVHETDNTIIISKYPFLTWNAEKNRVVAAFPYCLNSEKRFLIVCGIHFLAREDRKRIKVRRREFEEIVKKMKKYEIGKLTKNPKISENDQNAIMKGMKDGNIMMLGDTNFHCLCESLTNYELGFFDPWIELKYPENEGATWDPKTNKFTSALLPFDNRRMRLDRIFVNMKRKNLMFEDLEVVAKEGIGCFTLWAEVRPSDHYGLLGYFRIVENVEKFRKKKEIAEYLESVRKEYGTGFRKFGDIVKLRILYFSFMLLLSLILFFYLFSKLLKL